MTPVTYEEMMQEVEAMRVKTLAEFDANPEVPESAKTETVRNLWLAGEWLNQRLVKEGLEDADLRESLGLGHGQMSFFINPFRAAVIVYNKACIGDYVRGGRELADKLNDQHLKLKKGPHPDMEAISKEISAAIEEATFIEDVRDEIHNEADIPEGTHVFNADINGISITVFVMAEVELGVARKGNIIFKLKPEQAKRVRERALHAP